MGRSGWAAALVLAMTLTGVAWSQGAVYKTTDENGRVIYTDQKPASGKPVETVAVPSPNAMPAPAMPAADAPAAADQGRKEKAVPYTRFDMIEPEQGEVMEYDVTTARLAVRVVPPLQEGHTIQFYLDAIPYGPPGAALSTEVGGLARGAHRVDARLRDEQGRIIETTQVIEFHIRQHRTVDSDYYDGYPYYGQGVGQPRGVRSPGGPRQPGDSPGVGDIDEPVGFPDAGQPPVHRDRQARPRR